MIKPSADPLRRKNAITLCVALKRLIRSDFVWYFGWFTASWSRWRRQIISRFINDRVLRLCLVVYALSSVSASFHLSLRLSFDIKNKVSTQRSLRKSCVFMITHETRKDFRVKDERASRRTSSFPIIRRHNKPKTNNENVRHVFIERSETVHFIALSKATKESEFLRSDTFER